MSQEYRIYKPKKTNDGAASKFQISVKDKKVKDKTYEKITLFLTSSSQTGTDNNGNASFGWGDENKVINMQLNETDCSDILLVLTDRKDTVGFPKKPGEPGAIYHKNPRGSTVLKLYKSDKGGFILNISAERDKNLVRISHGITFGEGMVLEILIKDFISRKFGWKDV